MNRQKLARSEKALNIVTYIILTIVVIFRALPFILGGFRFFSDSSPDYEGWIFDSSERIFSGWLSKYIPVSQADCQGVWNQYLCYRIRHLHWINRYDALRLCVIQK